MRGRVGVRICDVVEAVRDYCGDEYSTEKINKWCMELSNNLKENYNICDCVDEFETVCESPYDTMYIDFCMAKIAWQQRDYDEYNQIITAFNTKLYEYGKYIRRNASVEDGGCLINWI